MGGRTIGVRIDTGSGDGAGGPAKRMNDMSSFGMDGMMGTGMGAMGGECVVLVVLHVCGCSANERAGAAWLMVHACAWEGEVVVGLHG